MTTGEGREPTGTLPSPRPTLLDRLLRGGAFRLIVVMLIDALLFSVIPAVIAGRSWTLLLLIGVIAALVNFAYLWPRAQALRWLTPGLVFLLLFVVWPLVYTAYVSLTNYQTGNVLSKDQVIEQLERQVIQSSGEGVDFQLDVYRDGAGQLAFLLTDPGGAQYFGVPRSRTDEPLEDPLLDPAELGVVGSGEGPPEQIGDFAFVPPLQRFQLANQLENLVLDIPGQGIAQVQTTSAARLVAGGSRYTYDTATDTLFDVQQDVTCVVEEGNFVCADGRRLDPGFRTVVGFRNYVDLFTNRALQGPFFKVFGWNVAFAFLSVLLPFAVGLLLANALQDDRMRGKPLYRSLLILPYAIPGFISIIIWRGLLNDQIGPVNNMLNAIGISDVPFLLNPLWAKVSMVLVNVWLGFPYMFLICSGALQAVPGELKEAARVDGAGAARVFRTITLPLLLVGTAPLLIGAFAFNFNNFALPFILTNGGPPVPAAAVPVGETDLLITFTYKIAVSSGRGNQYALASAIVILIFFIVAIISAISFRYTRRLEEVYGNV
ncbi:MAG TPA: ABC transporter permease subunit [Acidimicrobiia bacterium]|nr:ABC transporter permease subunit [Acidimicrobiia bacterium]